MRTRGRMRVAQGIAHGLLRDAQQLVLALGREASPITAPSKLQADAALDGGALGELAQRELEADAPRLVGPQRHHGAARFGEPPWRGRECA